MDVGCCALKGVHLHALPKPLFMGRLALAAKLPDSAEAQSALKSRAAAASVATSLILAAVKLAAKMKIRLARAPLGGRAQRARHRRERASLFAVREADKPADADHPFGHAKIEAVAALAQTGFLAALAVGVAIGAAARIRGGAGGQVDADAFAVGASCSPSPSTSRAGGR